MKHANLARLRLRAQRISASSLASPAEAVRWMGAMQAQDFNASLWAIGLRVPGSTEDGIRRAIARGSIVRTWPMRGTLHFVAPEHARWMLALLAPRVIAAAARRYRELELDDAAFGRSRDLFARAMGGGKCVSRKALMALLGESGISTAGQRGYHILARLAMEGLICHGPAQGAEQGFVLLDEWIPPAGALSREESLHRAALTYFRGHGPAALGDFARWTGLGIREAREGLDAAKDALERITGGGTDYWLAPPDGSALPGKVAARLLPSFDEYLTGYSDRSAMLAPGRIPALLRATGSSPR